MKGWYQGQSMACIVFDVEQLDYHEGLINIRWELWEAVPLIPNAKLFYYYYYITFSCVY